MKTVTELLREHALSNVGVFDRKPVPPLEELMVTEWSPQFERLCRDRLLMGAFRYGTFAQNRGRKAGRVESAIRRLQTFLKTGNAECLVDASNLCQVEFVCGNAVVKSVDDGEHYEFKEIGK